MWRGGGERRGEGRRGEEWRRAVEVEVGSNFAVIRGANWY